MLRETEEEGLNLVLPARTPLRSNDNAMNS